MYDGELFVQLEPVKLAPDTIGWKTKRTFDVFIASLTLFIASPLFMIVVALIKLTGQGPVFSRQICVGRGGRPFACLTFRTMVKDAGTVIPQAFRHSDQAAQTEWERTQRLVNGPRITAVGRVLRQSSLDKLPQFINVIRGDMSLVGPSPVVPSEVARYGDGLGWYLRVRPGMTGLFQVGRKGARYDQRIEMEADYVRNWRFATDLMLLLRTLGADAAHQA